MPQKLRILSNNAIDRDAWDACIASDKHALIYNYSWWLDHMAESWLGVVWNNYEAVLPVPHRKKWGLNMAYTPPFTQQLSIAGSTTPEIRTAMIEKLTQLFPLVIFQMNLPFPKVKMVKKRTNFILSLTRNYDEIFNQFERSCKKNINKAIRRGCVIDDQITLNQVFELYREAYGRKAGYTSEHYVRLQTVLQEAVSRKACHIARVAEKESGETVLGGLILDDGRRLYYLLGAPTQKGREMRATYFFLNQLIMQYAGQREVFDFEGSDIPNVAQFYQSFNPEKEFYYANYVNKFPFPLNKLLDMRLLPK